MRSNNLRIDIAKTPFSKYGSYMSVTAEECSDKLDIRWVRRRFGLDKMAALTFTREGQPVSYRLDCTPSVLTVVSESGNARIYMDGDDAVVIASDGLDVSLEPVEVFTYGSEGPSGRFKMIGGWASATMQIDVIRGKSSAQGPYVAGPGGLHQIDRRTHFEAACEHGEAVVRVQISQVETPPTPVTVDIERGIAAVDADWREFLSKMPAVTESRRESAETAWYTLWSCFVRAWDIYHYDAMLMSKNFMCSVWSWDHCFNALAMSFVDPRIALEQFLLPFELQGESGTLPDVLNPNTEILWGITKPPIHGWCFSKLLEQHQFDETVLRKVYRHLELWTNWWMFYRDEDGDGVPEYPQGCDSGWDNSTLFDIGFYLESPDLSSFLVLQMKTLTDLAGRLGDEVAREQWTQRAETLLKRLYEHLWTGERFVGRLNGTHDTIDPPTSLLALMPIVLGEHLEKDKFDKLVAVLELDFLTPFGLATEAPSSPLYEADGYWRGPIWAPSTYLIVDGLRRGGREDLAAEISKRFCDMIQHVAHGNYENFDALTGKGLRAPGYTWTASVNMLLMLESH